MVVSKLSSLIKLFLLLSIAVFTLFVMLPTSVVYADTSSGTIQNTNYLPNDSSLRTEALGLEYCSDWHGSESSGDGWREVFRGIVKVGNTIGYFDGERILPLTFNTAAGYFESRDGQRFTNNSGSYTRHDPDGTAITYNIMYLGDYLSLEV